MCGIIGILSAEYINEALYISMLQLQHRGRDGAGIFLTDPDLDVPILKKKGGLVTELCESIPPHCKARWGIGHIRYATSGKDGTQDAQPLAIKKQQKTLAIAHNGNIVNYVSLRQDLEKEGVTFQTTCDSETILHVLAENIDSTQSFFAQLCLAVEAIYKKIRGAYSIIGIMTQEGMFAFRDPQGIRPLLLGRKEGFFAFSSESFPLTQLGCASIEDVIPGEILFVDAHGALHRKKILCSGNSHSHCAFEFNYFAKTPTVMEGQEIHSVRANLGRLLAEKIQALELSPIDVVVSIPATASVSAIALAQALRIPYAEGFIRNEYVGRTFIVAGQEKRKKAVTQKLFPIYSVFDGKTVLLIDDSIIRGTVSKSVVALARQAGAKKVFFASTFPPVGHPCIYGIDFLSKDQLIAAHLSIPQICQEIGADALIFNDLKRLKKAIGLKDLCDACITGRYPTSTEGMEILHTLREVHSPTV